MDSECHSLTGCIVAQADRVVLFDHISSRDSKFEGLCTVDKFKSLVCPISAINCKEASRYLDQHFKERDRIDYGL